MKPWDAGGWSTDQPLSSARLRMAHSRLCRWPISPVSNHTSESAVVVNLLGAHFGWRTSSCLFPNWKIALPFRFWMVGRNVSSYLLTLHDITLPSCLHQRFRWLQDVGCVLKWHCLYIRNRHLFAFRIHTFAGCTNTIIGCFYDLICSLYTPFHWFYPHTFGLL